MSIAIMTLFASLCSLSSVENENRKWSSPAQVEIYKLQCVAWYVECEKRSSLGDTADVCVEKRLKYLQEKK